MRPIDGDVLEEAFAELADKLRHDGQKTDAQLLEALAAIVKYCPTLDEAAAVDTPAVDSAAVDRGADADGT